MTATTAADLLARANRLAIELRDSHHPATLAQWERFDVTLHRALHETLGPAASSIHRTDPHRIALLSAIRTYPTPLRPPADIPLTAAQAAHLLNLTPQGLRSRIQAGHLRAVHDGNAVAVHARDLDHRPDITPADPLDLHTLARLSVTLGALADLLHNARTTGQPVLDEPGEAAATARHLLAIGRVAAGHTLTAIAYADADRPLAIAQYTERVLDTLADATARPAGLDRLRIVTPHQASTDLGDRLEAALHTWNAAARADLGRPVPAAESVRFLSTQAVHLYAVTHQVITLDSGLNLDLDKATTAALAAAARAARNAGPLWANLTTLQRPTLEYVTASRALIPVLDAVTAAVAAPGSTEALDIRRALADLTGTAATIADLMATTRTLPDRLARSQLLHTPKNRTTLIDLRSRQRRTTRPATADDITHLAKAWADAGYTAHGAATQLHHITTTRLPHQLYALHPVERTL
ncbi:hypothetical protein [Nostocoides sp. HKS02]|uniref:hypothetical protein n=1 Tax=Nostocoides sp. HKS02 TaxID=1813880 RepID=UPI0012B48C61|nr:hypothetical protein [Tetrasphaera sp. HKS02]QGN58904.1 hypothetical protein GKE56_14535 [Tetrasphaera sp. HKS02]